MMLPAPPTPARCLCMQPPYAHALCPAPLCSFMRPHALACSPTRVCAPDSSQQLSVLFSQHYMEDVVGVNEVGAVQMLD